MHMEGMEGHLKSDIFRGFLMFNLFDYFIIDCQHQLYEKNLWVL
jgi:hypothetical protein